MTEMRVERTHMVSKTWLMLALPWSLIIIFGIVNFSIGLFLPLMQKEVGFDSSQAGYLTSIGGFVTILLTFPLTTFVNRYGSRRSLVITFVLFALSLFLQAATTSYWVILIARALNLGIFVFNTPALSQLKQSWVPITKMTEVNGLEAMMIPLGQILATALVPLFLTHLGTWQLVYQILGGVVLGLALVWFLWGKNAPPAEQSGQLLADKQKVSILRVLKHPVILLSGFCVIGTAAVSAATFAFWPTFAIDHFHYSLTTTGYILSLTPIASVLSSILIPWISRKTRIEKPLVWVWGFLMPVFYFLMLLSPNPLIVAPASFLAGFGSMAFVPLLLSYLFRIRGFSTPEVTLGVGIYNICVAIGLGLGPLVVSQIYQSRGDLGLALKICCLAPLALAIGGWLIPEETLIHDLKSPVS